MPEWDLSFHVMSIFFLDTISSTTWAGTLAPSLKGIGYGS